MTERAAAYPVQEFYPTPPPPVCYAPRHFSRKMSPETRFGPLVYALAALVILLVIVLITVRRGTPGAGDLASRLRSRGWVLHTKPGCGFCTQQLKEIGGGAGVLRMVCDKTSKNRTCAEAPGFPYWKNVRQGSVRIGLQSRAALEKMAKY